jgi:hypothetical protein
MHDSINNSCIYISLITGIQSNMLTSNTSETHNKHSISEVILNSLGHLLITTE